MSRPTRHPHKWIINNLDKSEVIESDFRKLENYIEDKEIQVGVLANKIAEANNLKVAIGKILDDLGKLFDKEQYLPIGLQSCTDMEVINYSLVCDGLERLRVALLIPRKEVPCPHYQIIPRKEPEAKK